MWILRLVKDAKIVIISVLRIYVLKEEIFQKLSYVKNLKAIWRSAIDAVGVSCQHLMDSVVYLWSKIVKNIKKVVDMKINFTVEFVVKDISTIERTEFVWKDMSQIVEYLSRKIQNVKFVRIDIILEMEDVFHKIRFQVVKNVT